MIPVARPSIRRRDMDSVLTCLISDSLGAGELSRRLVGEIAAYLGVSGGLAVRERSSALQLALLGLDLPPGAKVALTPLCPWFYHQAIVNERFLPTYIDIDPESGCIDAEALSEHEDISAVVADTPLGFVPNIDRLMELGIPVVEDISYGLGAHTGERKCGSHGRFAIVSLEPDAIITAGAGAAVFAVGRKERQFLKTVEQDLSEESFLPDMNAALGLTQIKQIESFVNRRREIAGIYSRAIMRGRHKMPVQRSDAENVYARFPVLLESGMGDVAAYARKKGVETFPAFAACALARMGTGTDAAPAELSECEYPNATAWMLRCLLFPLFPALTGKDVEVVERVLSTLP